MRCLPWLLLALLAPTAAQAATYHVAKAAQG